MNTAAQLVWRWMVAFLAIFLQACASTPPPFTADIAFHSLRHGASQIYLANSSTGESRRLRVSENEDLDATWSPDGRRIAFVSRDKGNADVYLIDVDGNRLRRLTDHPSFDGAPRWSPDGRMLAFVSTREGRSLLYLLHADGSGLRRLTSSQEGHEGDHVWSPDGQHVAFVNSTANRQMSVWVANANAMTSSKLTSEKGNETNPTWSPDGKQVALVAQGRGFSNIHVVAVADRSVRKLTADQVRRSRLQWSVDGTWLVYEGVVPGATRSDVFVVAATSGATVNLTDHPAEEMNASLREDGKRLAFVSYRVGGQGQVFLMDLESKAVKQLTDTGKLEFRPVWRPLAGLKHAGGVVGMLTATD